MQPGLQFASVPASCVALLTPVQLAVLHGPQAAFSKAAPLPHRSWPLLGSVGVLSQMQGVVFVELLAACA